MYSIMLCCHYQHAPTIKQIYYYQYQILEMKLVLVNTAAGYLSSFAWCEVVKGCVDGAECPRVSGGGCYSNAEHQVVIIKPSRSGRAAAWVSRYLHYKYVDANVPIISNVIHSLQQISNNV